MTIECILVAVLEGYSVETGRSLFPERLLHRQSCFCVSYMNNEDCSEFTHLSYMNLYMYM